MTKAIILCDGKYGDGNKFKYLKLILLFNFSKSAFKNPSK
jgi:hypothetical protein